MSKWVIFCVTALCLVGAERAGAIAVADYTVAEAAPSNTAYGAGLNWDFVYNYRSSSAVAVDHYWLLTGAHVAAHGGGNKNLIINNETYYEQEIVYHPDNADLALVRYDKPFPGYYLLHEGEISHEEGSGRWKVKVYDELLMVGFGAAGTVSETSFSNGGGKGIKRWGSNRGYDEVTFSGWLSEPGIQSTTSCFRTTFNLADTPYESGGNTGDSGSPVFIQSDGTWKVTGITLYRPSDSSNGMALIPDYVGWITNSIPDYDIDMDGLPDHWESSTGETDAGADPDGDGFSNYEEWLADTVPTLGTSFLEMLEYTNASSIAFTSSDERKYQIEYCENLTNQHWQIEASWFSGAESQTVHSVGTTDTNRFYRIRARLY